MNYNNIFENKKCSQLGMGFACHENGISESMVDYAMSHNLNYFEACTFYLDNQCETIIGNALSKYSRETYILCDKICLQGMQIDFENFDIEKFFNTQLQKCKVDYFDLYLFQGVNKRCLKILKNYPRILKFFIEKKKEGKIKKLGFSFHDNFQTLKDFIEFYNWDIVQIQINFFDWYRDYSKELYFYLKEKNIPIIAMEPCKGRAALRLTPLDFKEKLLYYFPNKNFYQVSLSFLQQLPNIKIILTGAANLIELSQNINWINQNLPFTNTDEKLCKMLLENFKQYNYIPCTGCKYCESVCPKHLRIKDMFFYTNNILLNNNKKENQENLTTLLKSTPYGFYWCTHCHSCEKMCPQHLPITKYFMDVVRKMEG